MLIDTHAHLYLDVFDEDIEEVIVRAREQGVEQVLLPNIDVSSLEALHHLTRRDPDYFKPMLGLHPCSVQSDYRAQLKILFDALDMTKHIAIGEIGLDYYWDKTFIREQKDAFRIQVEWASEHDLPIVIHSRDSIDDILNILEDLKIEGLRGVFHCFTGTVEQAARIMKLSFYMGLGGVLTFKNSGLDQVVSQLPLEYLVVETDAPYLTPHPYRGKRNESSYVRLVAEKLADTVGVALQDIEKVTSENARKLFRL